MDIIEVHPFATHVRLVVFNVPPVHIVRLVWLIISEILLQIFVLLVMKIVPLAILQILLNVYHVEVDISLMQILDVTKVVSFKVACYVIAVIINV